MTRKRRGKFPQNLRFVTRFFSLALALSVIPSAAYAQVVLDPNSGSYFELVVDTRNNAQGWLGVWAEARQEAESRFYKGIHGRLAVIKSRETHEFIKDNLEIGGFAWIGLRYFCSSRRLMWVTGESLKTDTDFQPWHRRWARTDIRCDAAGYMPVYYTDTNNNSLSWQASGPSKGFSSYIVEYPAR